MNLVWLILSVALFALSPSPLLAAWWRRRCFRRDFQLSCLLVGPLRAAQLIDTGGSYHEDARRIVDRIQAARRLGWYTTTLGSMAAVLCLIIYLI